MLPLRIRSRNVTDQNSGRSRLNPMQNRQVRREWHTVKRRDEGREAEAANDIGQLFGVSDLE